MQIHQVRILALAWALSAAAASPLWAAGHVRLELVGDAAGSALDFQQWAQTLGKAGVKDVQIHASDEPVRPGIDVQGTPQSPFYVVTGIVKSRDELLLPSGTFKRADAARLARWLDDLAVNGPPDRRPPKSAFGLTAEQFQQLHEALARPVAFSTRGMARGEVVAKIARQVPLLLPLDAESARAVGGDKVADELQDLACGTALACLLRPAGCCLLPRADGPKPVLAVVKTRPGLQAWPVGWEPPKDKPVHDLLPAMFEFLNVNVQNIPAAQAAEAIGQRLKVPVLFDHQALARHGIDPVKAMVSLPQGRTTYSLALGKLLSKAGLKFEVRLDEADQPLLWISTVKPS